CKQCGRLYMPKLIIKNSITECIAKDASAFFGDISDDALDFTAVQDQIKNAKDVTVCIGPEAGFTDEELKEMNHVGMQGVRLHHNVLRAETAAIAAAVLFTK